jgi:hypothetical protein
MAVLYTKMLPRPAGMKHLQLLPLARAALASRTGTLTSQWPWRASPNQLGVKAPQPCMLHLATIDPQYELYLWVNHLPPHL